MDKTQELLHDIRRAVRFSQEVFVPIEKLILDPATHEFGIRTYAAVEAELEERVRKNLHSLSCGLYPVEKEAKMERKLSFDRECLVCCRNSKSAKQKQILSRRAGLS